MKANFFTLLIVALATTCFMSFERNQSDAIVKQTSSLIVVDGYYVDGDITVHIECTTVGGGRIASIRIVDANNDDLALYGKHTGSASVNGDIITLTGFTQSFYWTDHSVGFTRYDGDLIPE